MLGMVIFIFLYYYGCIYTDKSSDEHIADCCFTGYHSLCSVEIQMYTCYKFDCRLSNRLLSVTAAAVLPLLTLTQSADAAGVSMRVSMRVSSPLYYDH